MKISVLMPVYYKEKPENLRSAIESIVTQTVMPEQIVIVKDGVFSSKLDNVLIEFKNKYDYLIDIFECKNEKRLGGILKFGVLKCKYEWIARMDSDDISCKTRFENQIKFIEDNKDIDIIGRLY